MERTHSSQTNKQSSDSLHVLNASRKLLLYADFPIFDKLLDLLVAYAAFLEHLDGIGTQKRCLFISGRPASAN